MEEIDPVITALSAFRRQMSRATSAVTAAFLGRRINCKVRLICSSESTRRYGDSASLSQIAWRITSSKAGSPVLLAKSARTMESRLVRIGGGLTYRYAAAPAVASNNAA